MAKKSRRRRRREADLPDLLKQQDTEERDTVPLSQQITTQLASHVLNGVAARDRLIGKCMPQSLRSVLDAIWQSCREGITPVPCNRLTQITELCLEPMQRVFNAPRTALYRSHKMVPLHRLKEMDHKSMCWAGRLPGRNFREKLTNRRTTLGPVREFSQETLENQLTGTLARYLERELEAMLANIADFEDDVASQARARQCQSLYEICGQIRRTFGEFAVQGSSITPNNVLLSDTNYSRIWRGWQWLQHARSDAERAQEEMVDRFLTSAFWTTVARLAQAQNTRFIDRPCLVSDGYMERPYVLLHTENDHWQPMASLHFLWLRQQADDRYTAGGVITLSQKSDAITLTYEALSDTLSHRSSDAFVSNFQLKFTAQTSTPDRGMQLAVYEQSDGQRRFHCLGFADIEGLRHLAERIFKTLERWNIHLYPPSLEAVVLESTLHATIAVDFSSVRPMLTYNGTELACATRFACVSHPLPEQEGTIHLPIASNETVADLCGDYTIHSVRDLTSDVSPDTLGHRSTAVAMILQSVLVTAPQEGHPRLVYTIPDSVDAFSLGVLREAMRNHTKQVYPLFRSVAAALAWQKRPNFQESPPCNGDELLVFDCEGDALTITPLLARVNDKLQRDLPQTRGIVWERHPCFEADARDVDLTFDALCKIFIQDAQNHQQIPRSWMDVILRTGLAERCLTERTSAVHLYQPSERWLELSYDEQLLSQSLTTWQDRFKTRLKAWHEDDAFQRRFVRGHPRNIYILLLGRVFPLLQGNPQMDPQSLLEDLFADTRCTYRNLFFVPPVAVCLGGEAFLWREYQGLPSWREYLPLLKMEVIKGGRYDEITLISETLVDPTIGQKQYIRIPEKFVLPAGQRELSFPLITGTGGRLLNHAARLRSPSFPLKDPLPASLEITYEYGAQDTYTLHFRPTDVSAPFTTLQAEWIDPRQIQADQTNEVFLYPEYPKPLSWEDLCTHLNPRTGETMDLIQWFVESCYRYTQRIDDILADDDWDDDESTDLGNRLGRSFSISTRILWNQGRGLFNAPKEVDQAFKVITPRLLLLAFTEKHRLVQYNPETQKTQGSLRGVALRLLCRFHEDLPQDFVQYVEMGIRETVASRSGSAFGFLMSNAGYLVGNGEGVRGEFLESLFDLMQQFRTSNSLNPQGVRQICATLGTALWRHPGLIRTFASQDSALELLLTSIDAGLRFCEQELQSQKLSPFISAEFQNHGKLLLGLLQLRNPSLLAGASDKVRELLVPQHDIYRIFAQRIRRIDAALARHKMPIDTQLVQVKKPAHLDQMSDLAFSLNAYLTGSFEGAQIQIYTESGEDD